MHKMFMLVLTGFWLSGAAQQSQQSLLGAAGGHAETASYIIDWTLGDAVVESATSTTRLYTQGFLQPLLLKRRPAPVAAGPSLGATATPNPVQNELRVTLAKPATEPLMLSMYNALGVIMQQVQVARGTSLIPLNTSALTRGSYLVLLRGTEGTVLESFNIIKLH